MPPVILRDGIMSAAAAAASFSVTPPSNFPPIPPASLSASPGPTSVTLTWPAGSDPGGVVAGYNVYRVISGVDTFDAFVTGLTRTVGGLTESTSYTFRVRTLDDAGLESDPVSVTTTTTSSANPFNLQFGIVAGNQGTPATMQEVADIVDAGTDRLAIWRRGLEMQNVYEVFPNFTNYPQGGGFDQFLDKVDALGHLALVPLSYCAVPHQRTLPLGAGTLTAGNSYLQLTNPVPVGPLGSIGKWDELAVMGPGLPTTAPFVLVADSINEGGPGNFSSDRRQVRLQRNGATYTIPSTVSGTYQVGGADTEWTNHMTPKCSASNTTTLEPYGDFVFGMVTAMGAKVFAVELGNEYNHTLGVRPYADPALAYRNLCHGYCGAKLANPDVYVLPPGPGDNSGLGAFPDPLSWYTRLKAERTTNQPNYFSNLKASLEVTSLGPDPWDVLSVHAYGGNPGSASSTSLNYTAAIYNLFGGQYMVCGTEQGVDWTPDGSEGVTAAAAKTWCETIFGYVTGKLQWDKNTSFTGTAGANLESSNMATRQTAARQIFWAWFLFSLVDPGGGPTSIKGLYTEGTVGTRKFALSGEGNDPVGFLKDFWSS